MGHPMYRGFKEFGGIKAEAKEKEERRGKKEEGLNIGGYPGRNSELCGR